MIALSFSMLVLCRYFAAGWVKEVLYHPISQGSPVGLFATTVTPSMAISKKPYKVWAAVVKDSAQGPGGEIVSAYCTCTAG